MPLVATLCALLLAGVVTGCGQKGALRLPGSKPDTAAGAAAIASAASAPSPYP